MDVTPKSPKPIVEADPMNPVAAGQNVIATIGGKEVGPIYCVQIADGMATLQGAETHVVPVGDLTRAV